MNTSVSGSDRSRRTYSAKGFWSLVVTQFQGAFNDNLYRYVMVYTLAVVLSSGDGPVDRGQITAFSGVLMALPFILFPGFFGSLSDRFSKKRIAVWTKYLEVGVMGLGAVGFYFQEPMFLWAVMFLMATQSAMFGPAKYGILPETLPEERLSWSNGIIQMTTMIAIIAGTASAGSIYEWLGPERIYLAGFMLMALSGIGLLSSFGISAPPAASPERSITYNPWAGMGRDLTVIWKDRWLRMIAFGYSYFWFAGALLFSALMDYAGSQGLGLPESETSVMNAVLSLGIGVGSFGAGYLSRGKVELGLVPIGAAILALGCILMPWIGVSYLTASLMLFAVGVGGGLFDVPVAAGLQQRSPREIRGSIIATTSMLSWVGILFGSALYLVLPYAGIDSSGVFILTGLLTLAALGISCAITPAILVRAVLWVLSNSVYRLKVTGSENIPEEGGILFVANHTSYVDALMIVASTGRNVRFVMYQGLHDSPVVRLLSRLMGSISIAADQSPREMARSLRTATAALESGEAVCIFAEGQITRTGQLLPFRKEFERIVNGVEVPIIPVHLGNLWGSIFSFSGGRFLWKVPTKIPYPVTVNYGAPMPSDSPADAVRRSIQELGTAAFAGKRQGLLHRMFARRARHQPFSEAIADGLTPRMSCLKALSGSLIFARRLRGPLGQEKMVGVLLPPSVGATLVNVALQWLGKTPVNLNYTASAEYIESACSQCDIGHVISSTAFLEKIKIAPPRPAIFVERERGEISAWDRLVGFLWAACLPSAVIERLLGAPRGRSENDLATVVFSSGSEGEPKGVMLTHRNLASNIEATLQVFPHNPSDGIMGILPFFHSMGFMGTLWLPLVSGTRVVYHPNPLDARAIGGLVYANKSTFLMTTSTLLQFFIRQCPPEHASSLKYVICGAEKLADRVREACKDKFGIEPIEGYGVTECSPLVCLNVPNFRVPGFFQRGTKNGTVGHPIPGVSVRIVNPDERTPMGVDEPGMLLVKGPNVMRGYLGKPEKTASVLRDDWYETGDIATVDEDGFITITGRLSRFSKIAGEMVPHGKVEDSLHQLLGLAEQALAVVGLPDEKKGEKLVVLHTLDESQVVLLQEKLKKSDLPNLWIPAPNAFHRIDAIPLIGSGKVDLRSLRELAEQYEAGS